MAAAAAVAAWSYGLVTTQLVGGGNRILPLGCDGGWVFKVTVGYIALLCVHAWGSFDEEMGREIGL